MAWQTPKLDWKKEDVVGVADLNRIEGNIAELKKAATIDVADVANNFTASPKNVENVLNEIAGDVKNGKTAIANAILARNGSASPIDTFSNLANSILAIPFVKSVQQGYFFTDVPPANTTTTIQQTININAVDPNKSIILVTPMGAVDVYKLSFLNAYFNNSTSFTIQASITTNEIVRTPFGTLGFTWVVIEFQPSAVKSLQRGSGQYNRYTLDITINAVNLSKSLVIVQGWYIYPGIYFQGVGGILTSNTNLRLFFYNNANIVNAYSTPYFWQVIEFI